MYLLYETSICVTDHECICCVKLVSVLQIMNVFVVFKLVSVLQIMSVFVVFKLVPVLQIMNVFVV